MPWKNAHICLEIIHLGAGSAYTFLASNNSVKGDYNTVISSHDFGQSPESIRGVLSLHITPEKLSNSRLLTY